VCFCALNMADIVINDLKRSTQKSLRELAEKHGRSVSDEAREIIEKLLERFEPADNLYDAIRADVSSVGGVEFQALDRFYSRELPFSDVDDEPNDGE
jgi:plasmid stability protein